VSLSKETPELLQGLVEAGISFIVVGGAAGVILGAPIVTLDLDIVHQKAPDNIDRLLAWLLGHGAYHRYDLANRRLPPTREQLAGEGHLNLQLDLGKLDVLCQLSAGEDYENLIEDTVLVENGSFQLRVLELHRLIAVKARAGRPKDRAVLPVLMATLDEQKRR
jgi:hypothetical protein